MNQVKFDRLINSTISFIKVIFPISSPIITFLNPKKGRYYCYFYMNDDSVPSMPFFKSKLRKTKKQALLDVIEYIDGRLQDKLKAEKEYLSYAKIRAEAKIREISFSVIEAERKHEDAKLSVKRMSSLRNKIIYDYR